MDNNHLQMLAWERSTALLRFNRRNVDIEMPEWRSTSASLTDAKRNLLPPLLLFLQVRPKCEFRRRLHGILYMTPFLSR